MKPLRFPAESKKALHAPLRRTSMATTTKRPNVAKISVSLNPNSPKKQNLDTINRLVAQVAGRAGCDGCGRIAYIDVHFLGDPDPDMEKLGAISVDISAR
jgi:hypothetical protein